MVVNWQCLPGSGTGTTAGGGLCWASTHSNAYTNTNSNTNSNTHPYTNSNSYHGTSEVDVLDI
jgi:hypothetical protein